MSSEEKGGSDSGAASGFVRLPMTVGGQKVTADDAVLIVDSVDEGHRRVASQMSWWGKVWAEAQKELSQVDAHYRKWRAQKFLAIDGGEKTKGLPEWKVKAHIEADPEFLRYKGALAQCEANVITAKTQFESFSEKARQIQSMGARDREELVAGRKDTTRRRRVINDTDGMVMSDPVSLEGFDEDGVEVNEVSAEKVAGGKEKMRAANAARAGKKN